VELLTDKLIDRIVYFKNVFAIGQVWIKMPIDFANVSLLMEISNFLKLNYPIYSDAWLTFLPVSIVVWIASCFMFGRWLDKEKHVVHSETKFSASRTERFDQMTNMLQDVQSRLRRIEGKM
jgi:hypothetical protein